MRWHINQRLPDNAEFLHTQPSQKIALVIRFLNGRPGRLNSDVRVHLPPAIIPGFYMLWQPRQNNGLKMIDFFPGIICRYK